MVDCLFVLVSLQDSAGISLSFTEESFAVNSVSWAWDDEEERENGGVSGAADATNDP